jgi:hypothetical protein
VAGVWGCWTSFGPLEVKDMGCEVLGYGGGATFLPPVRPKVLKSVLQRLWSGSPTDMWSVLLLPVSICISDPVFPIE